MSHQHFCDVAGHWWECAGSALRAGDKEPSVCMCLRCGVPLEFGDHSHDYVELLACPEHRKVNAAITTPRQAEPGAERGVLRDRDGNPIVGFCLWCDKDFYSMEEVDAHNADNMKACPVHELSITHKFGFLVHDRFDFVADVERDVHGALARASRRSVSMSLCSLR